MNIERIKLGAYSGVAGGIIFGMMMGMMGMLPMVGMMAGSSSAAVGFLVHMGISTVIGAGFGVLLGATAHRMKPALGAGMAYGFAWWLLGPLTLMPLFMGMGLGANWSTGAMAQAMPSLMGHVLFGAVVGFTYHRLLLGSRRQLAIRAA